MTDDPTLAATLDRIWTELVQLELDMALIHSHLGITRPVDTAAAVEVLSRVDRFLADPSDGVRVPRPRTSDDVARDADV